MEDLQAASSASKAGTGPNIKQVLEANAERASSISLEYMADMLGEYGWTHDVWSNRIGQLPSIHDQHPDRSDTQESQTKQVREEYWRMETVQHYDFELKANQVALVSCGCTPGV